MGDSGGNPRVCGGTRLRNSQPLAPVGLSLRVRGNHGAWELYPSVTGSIPACAGEPIVPHVSILSIKPALAGGGGKEHPVSMDAFIL